MTGPPLGEKPPKNSASSREIIGLLLVVGEMRAKGRAYPLVELERLAIGGQPARLRHRVLCQEADELPGRALGSEVPRAAVSELLGRDLDQRQHRPTRAISRERSRDPESITSKLHLALARVPPPSTRSSSGSPSLTGITTETDLTLAPLEHVEVLVVLHPTGGEEPDAPLRGNAGKKPLRG